MSFSGTKGYITKPKPGVMLNPLHPLSRGLVGYWLFNEGSGSLANDISGYGNHGTLINMLPNTQGSGWSGSKFGGALQFDGVNDYVDIATPPITGSQDRTIIAWIKTSTHTRDIVSWGSAVAGQESRLGFNADGKFFFGVYSGHALFTSVVTDNEINCIGVALNGTKTDDVTGYFNGEPDTRSALSSQTIDTANTNGAIGRKDSSADRYFSGPIYMVLIYDYSLTDDKMKILYQDPFCNLMQVPIRRYSVAAPPVGAIMNQFQTVNLGADLYQGAIIA